MKLTLVSDLHVDFPHSSPLKFEQTDLILIAGDIANNLGSSEKFLKRLSFPFYAVDGNHDHYSNVSQGRTITDTLARFWKHPPTMLLDNGVTVVGTNGWYEVGDHQLWVSYMNDGRRINSSLDGAALQEAQELRGYIEAAPGPVIVVTHTAPCEATLDPRYAGHYSNQWYWNPHMEPLLQDYSDRILFWHHGHTHFAQEKMVHGVRVITNPRGYPGENPHWKPLQLELDI